MLNTLKELKLDKNTLGFSPAIMAARPSPATRPCGVSKAARGKAACGEPTIAWWPGKIATGSTCDAVMSEIDVLPTLLRLAGGKVPADRKIDGLDIWPVLSGQSKESPHELALLLQGAWAASRALRSVEVEHRGRKKTEGGGGGKRQRKKGKQPGLPPCPTHRNCTISTVILARRATWPAIPDVVKRLQELIARMDKDLGKGKDGPGVRPAGHVDNPKPLLMRQPNEYD